jgi:amidohydrolase
MPIVNRIADLHGEITAWRRDIHAHPELLYDVHRTAGTVADKLKSFGCDEVVTGIGRTGVVGVIRGAKGAGSSRVIGLRADMDALPIEEANDVPYKSMVPGKMHACGHDGHTVMLLGAAKYLAETKNFDGTVYFIFQPAEENEGGGRVMVEEGLFDKFPVEGVYGMHNIPGIPVGRFAVRPGPMMAAYDIFEVVVKGVGAHGAMPHHGIDPVVVGSHIVTALQSIVARNVDPMDTAVVSTTQIHAGDTWNVIPQECTLRGTVRTFKKPVQDMIERRIEQVARNVAAGFGAEVAKWRYERRYPATVNSEQETEFAAKAAGALVGLENVNRNPTPAMGSEDFAWMLLKRPGCYIWIGNGDGAGSCMVHNPGYDFNDDILPIGASYWATLVEQQLARQAIPQAAD